MANRSHPQDGACDSNSRPAPAPASSGPGWNSGSQHTPCSFITAPPAPPAPPLWSRSTPVKMAQPDQFDHLRGAVGDEVDEADRADEVAPATPVPLPRPGQAGANNLPTTHYGSGQEGSATMINSNFIQIPPQPSPYRSLYPPLPVHPDPVKTPVEFVTPIDTNQHISKQEYDPNTIARDVLLALGIHPDRPGLNDHLKPLFLNFSQVDYNSDLSTFRWDLVDGPGFFSHPIATDMPPMFEEPSNGFQKSPVQPPSRPNGRGLSPEGLGMSSLALHPAIRVDALQVQRVPHTHPTPPGQSTQLSSASYQYPMASHTHFLPRGSAPSKPFIQRSSSSAASVSGLQPVSSTPPNFLNRSFPPSQGNGPSATARPGSQPGSSTISNSFNRSFPSEYRVQPYAAQRELVPELPVPASYKRSFASEPKPQADSFKRTLPPEPSYQPKSFSTILPPERKENQSYSIQRGFAPEPKRQSNISVVLTSAKISPFPEISSSTAPPPGPSYQPKSFSSILPPERKKNQSIQRGFAPEPKRQSNISVVLTSAKISSFPEISSSTASREHESSNGFSYRAPHRSPSSTSRNLGNPKTSSRIAVEIPMSTPEKLAQSTFKTPRKNPSSKPIPKKRGKPFATPEAVEKAQEKTARRTAQLTSRETRRLRRRNVDSGSDSNVVRGHAGSKKKGRPFVIRHHVDVEPPEPNYIPFICEWKGCPAQLHNLETLRLHVLNVHKKKLPSGKRPCRWRKCDGEEFGTKEEWKDHIEEEHLIPFAWHVGDGPRGSLLAPPQTYKMQDFSYLKDDNGRQVTASVKRQRILEGRPKEYNRKRFRAQGGNEEDTVYHLIKELNFDRKVREQLEGEGKVDD